MPRRKSLNAEEKLTAAYGVLILGLAQHDVAAMMGCNAGRVAEAVTACKAAVNWQADFEFDAHEVLETVRSKE